MFNKLLKLATKLDDIGQYKIADAIDLLIKNAAKVDKLKEQWPKDADVIEQINNADPTPTKKYLEWGVKQFRTGMYTINEVATTIKQFHQHNQKLENKDINSYKTIEEVERALVGKDLPSKRQLKEISKSGAETIYDSPNYIVIHPKTKESVCTYGAGTKWCITMKNENHYENYSSRGIVFYYILDRHPKDEIMNKVAIALNVMQGSAVFEAFDAQDRQIDISALREYYKNEWPSIESALKTNAKSEGIESSLDYMRDAAISGTDEQKYDIATNQNIPVDILKILAKDEADEVRSAVGKNPNTPSNTLNILAQDHSADVRSNVALNINAADHILDALARDESGNVRMCVAGNSNTSIYTLALLAQDKDELVRLVVVRNPNTTKDILNILLKDQSELVSSRADLTLQQDNISNEKQSSRKARLQKLSEQLENRYYPIGQKGDEYGGDADQDGEVAEEINEEMETNEMEGYTPGNDNLIIDKNNNPTDGFGVLAKLQDNAILLKSRLLFSALHKMNK